MQINYYNTGFSLIEVLVALCLMTIILLGVAKVHLQSARASQRAMFISQASEQLRTMADIIYATNGNYAAALSEWNQDNKGLLPNGQGEIRKNGAQYRIYLFWRSGKNFFWRCDVAQKNKQSCVELIL